MINNFGLKSKDMCVYDNKFRRTHFISDIMFLYKKFFLKSFYPKSKTFSLCGRIFRKRVMGKSIFLDLMDVSGKIQIYLFKGNFEALYKNLVSCLSLGDIIGVTGVLFVTKTNELSLKANLINILSKNLLPFPDKRFGLIDRESCYRQRYLDLMVNDNTKNLFYLRSKIISKVREFFILHNYLEVETPVIQLIPGGADAKPFITYHNYLDSKMFFRISPELYLKRLVIGGYEKVFEIGKNFRNEGISTRHHPEFTTIEFYQAYTDYIYLMGLTEKLFRYLAVFVFNKYSFNYDNNIIDFSLPFKRIDFLDAIIFYNKCLKKQDLKDYHVLSSILSDFRIEFIKDESLGELQFKLFEHTVEKKLIQPTFILHHPKDISPLSRVKDDDKSFVERFELYISGKEIANGFSELNDPIDQMERFLQQLKKHNDQDGFVDKDYVNALKYGLPPTAGEGIGLDRLIMLFTNSLSIKDVILFPLMKFK